MKAKLFYILFVRMSPSALYYVDILKLSYRFQILYEDSIISLLHNLRISSTKTRVCGIKRSVSTRYHDGDGFDTRTKPRHT